MSIGLTVLFGKVAIQSGYYIKALDGGVAVRYVPKNTFLEDFLDIKNGFSGRGISGVAYETVIHPQRGRLGLDHCGAFAFCQWADAMITKGKFLKLKAEADADERRRVGDLVSSLYFYIRTGYYTGFEDGEIADALRRKGGIGTRRLARLKNDAASIKGKNDVRLVGTGVVTRFMRELGFKFQR